MHCQYDIDEIWWYIKYSLYDIDYSDSKSILELWVFFAILISGGTIVLSIFFLNNFEPSPREAPNSAAMLRHLYHLCKAGRTRGIFRACLGGWIQGGHTTWRDIFNRSCSQFLLKYLKWIPRGANSNHRSQENHKTIHNHCQEEHPKNESMQGPARWNEQKAATMLLGHLC